MTEEAVKAQDEAATPATTDETPVVEAAKVEETVADKKEEEVKQVEEAKKEDVPNETKSEEIVEEAKQDAEPPVYDNFELPEGLDFVEEKIGEFKSELADFQVKHNLDKDTMQELGQKLINRHVSEMQRFHQEINDGYVKKFEEMAEGWKDSSKSDPEIGGKRFEATVNNANAAIERAFSATEDSARSKEELSEFQQLMNDTGIGNHRALLRVFSRLNQIIDGYESERSKSIPASKSVTSGLSGKLEKMYGKK